MTSIPFTIREARAGDIDKMAELLHELFSIEDDFTADEKRQRHGIAALMADHSRCTVMVAVVNGIVVGMCSAQITYSTAEGGVSALVEDMIVSPAVRRNGIGTALFAAVRDWALNHGCTRMQLLADSRNEAALRFYANLDWSVSHMICLHYKPVQRDFTHTFPFTGKSTHSTIGKTHATHS